MLMRSEISFISYSTHYFCIVHQYFDEDFEGPLGGLDVHISQGLFFRRKLNSFQAWSPCIMTPLMLPWPQVVLHQSASIIRQVSANLLKNANGDTRRKSVKSRSALQRNAESATQSFASSLLSTTSASLEISAATSISLPNLTTHLTFL